MTLEGTRILLVIGGGIAAYKSLDLIRRLKEQGATVRCILTRAAQEFVTPLAAASLSGRPAATDLFSSHQEMEVGHIGLAREPDLIIVAPATADLMAKMAGGHADDLATTVLLATTRPILIAPAMNVRMWLHRATRRNLEQLLADGISVVGPAEGAMAEAEFGPGRMSEPADIVVAAEARLRRNHSLAGRRVLVTSGPTHEPIDPVRYLANRSSGRQGHAIAEAAAEAGAIVTLVSGPVSLPDPRGVAIVRVETAREMLEACMAAMPSDAAVFAAAVADWRVESEADRKLKKDPSGAPPDLSLVENPDILATIARHSTLRPRLVIGFAAETHEMLAHAEAKRTRKNADWIVANDVSPAGGAMGGTHNRVTLITRDGTETWPDQPKEEVARCLVARIAAALEQRNPLP